MNREEEIIKASVEYNVAKGKLNVIGGDAILSDEEFITFNKNPQFIDGAKWADEHPRLDVAGPTSATRVRMILLRNFVNAVKKHPGKSMEEVPEIKEAFDLIDNLDKCCEVAGFILNDDTGFYNIPE